MVARPTPFIPPDDTLPSDQFLIEDHIADTMPSAHWHDHVEVNYLPQGQMDYLLNGRRVTLLPRRLGVFWAAVHHQSTAVGENLRIICAYLPIGDFLSLSLPPAFRAAVLQGDLVQTADEHVGEEVRLTEMIACWQDPSPVLRQIVRDEMTLRLRRMALEPIAQTQGPFAAQPGAARKDSKPLMKVELMTTYINQNLGRDLSVTEVAAASDLHPTTARAAFRQVLGTTISNYIRRQQLSTAMRLLTETDHSIAEIAHLAGYHSLQRLYDAFKAQLGRTPRRYRQDMMPGAVGRSGR